MASITFIHAADFHLDAPFQSTIFFDDRWIDRLEQSTWKAFDNLLEIAIEQKVDFLVLSGDLFDQESYNLKAKEKFLQKIKRMGNHQIHSYIIFGNHDLAIDDKDLYTMLTNDPYIHVFSNDKVETITHYKEGVAAAKLFGRGFWEPCLTDNPVREYMEVAARNDDKDEEKIHNRKQNEILKIAIAHGRVGVIDAYLPCASYPLNDMKATNVHYWAMGHVHKQKISIDTSPLVVNPGKIQATSTDELGCQGCYVVRWEDAVLKEIRFQSLEAVRFEEHVFDFDQYSHEESTTMDSMLETLNKQLHECFIHAKKPLLIQLVLKGRSRIYSEHAKLKSKKRMKRKLTNSNVIIMEIFDRSVPYLNREQYSEQYKEGCKKAKTDPYIFALLEQSLQQLYGNNLFQQITETGHNQRGRGQWKQKKIKKEWIEWLEQVEKLGIGMLFLTKRNQMKKDDYVWEVVHQLNAEQKRYFLIDSKQTIIFKNMLDYEKVNKECMRVRENMKYDERIVVLNRLRFQADGELFDAVKQWTLYTMAKWIFMSVLYKQNIENKYDYKYTFPICQSITGLFNEERI